MRPERCQERTKKGKPCPCKPMDTADPDGGWRCTGHSQKPELVLARKGQGQRGRDEGEKTAKPRARKLDEHKAPPNAELPEVLDLSSVAGVRDLLEAAARNLQTRAWEPSQVNAAANLSRVALAALALPDAADTTEKPLEELVELAKAGKLDLVLEAIRKPKGGA